MQPPSGPYESQTERMWILKPGAAIPWAQGESINERAMRGPMVAEARDPSRLRIAVLGSGAALGTGMPWQATWAAQFAQKLEQRGQPAECLVAACEGATVRMSMERWRRDLSTLQPDVVFLCHAGTDELTAAALGISDDQRLSDPQRFQAQPGRFDAVRSSARVVQYADWLLDIQNGSYWSWRLQVLDEERLRAAQQTFDVKGVRRVLWSEFLEQTRALGQEIKASGTKLILFPIPGEALLRGRSPVAQGYLTVIEKLAPEAKFTAFSPKKAFQDSGKPVDELYRDGQLSAEGHRILAEFLDTTLGARAGELRR